MDEMDAENVLSLLFWPGVPRAQSGGQCVVSFGIPSHSLHQYLSEAGASIVDQNLNLNVVPKTKVVHLASASFYYGNINRYRAQIAHDLAERFPEIGKHMRQGLPPKVGSLQMFVRGYKVSRCHRTEVKLISSTGCAYTTTRLEFPVHV